MICKILNYSPSRLKKLLYFILLSALGGLLMSSSLFIASAMMLPQEPDFAAIDGYIEAEMKADNVPGLSLAIVREDQIVHLRGFGVAGPDGHPVTPQTSFILGSMSKSFTALAIMQLVELGQVDLDAPVQQYIPWFRVASADESGRITVRHLLNHTSGLPTNAPRAEGETLTLEAHVRALESVTLVHKPGTRHEYSSPNYQILGLLVETVSGQSFGEYVQQHIFSPLEMKHSFVSQPVAMQAGMATGHQYWFGFPVAADLPYEDGRLPTSALISSAEDMGHYLVALLNEGVYNDTVMISPVGFTELLRPAAEGNGFAYAMGWRVGPVNGLPAVHHGGQVPHFRGKIVLLPAERWGVVVLTNASSFLGNPTSHRLANGVASLLVGQTPPSPSFSLWALYIFVSLGMLAITINLIKDIVTIPRWRTQIAPRPGNTSGLLRQTGVDIAIPLILLVGLPWFFGLSWVELIRQMPDAGYWVIISALIGLGVGLLKAGMAFTALRKVNRPAVAQTEG